TASPLALHHTDQSAPQCAAQRIPSRRDARPRFPARVGHPGAAAGTPGPGRIVPRHRRPAARSEGGSAARDPRGPCLCRGCHHSRYSARHADEPVGPRPRHPTAVDRTGSGATSEVGEMSEITRDTLMAFIDGQLDHDASAAVEAYLAANPEAALELGQMQRQTDAIQALYGPVASEPVPARLDPHRLALRQ